MNNLISLFQDYTFQVVAIGSISLGVLCGLAGTFAVIRKQSLLGDSIAHASLAGIAISFMITKTRSTSVLLIGALIFGLIATLIINFFARNTRINYESSLALVMSSLFGLGLILLTQIQKHPSANQAGLEKFLFGQAATILKSDVQFICFLMLIMVLVVLISFKELKVYSFDPIFSQTMGINVNIMNFILNSLVVSSVIAGIQMVGVVLISALLVSPAVAARQWSQSLKQMLVLTVIIASTSGLMGTILSSSFEKLPTGPMIVVVLSIVVILSLFFAPERGILASLIRRQYAKKSYKAEMAFIHYFTHHDSDLNSVVNIQKLYQASVKDHNESLSIRQLHNYLTKLGLVENSKEGLVVSLSGLKKIKENGDIL